MADFHHQDNKDIASGDSIRKILVVDNDASTAELIRDNIAPVGVAELMSMKPLRIEYFRQN